MADSETQQAVDATKQVTSKTPAKKTKKHPNHVAAGKAIAQKTKQAREAQKRLLSRHRASLQIVRSKMLTHHVWLNHRLWLAHCQLEAPKTF